MTLARYSFLCLLLPLVFFALPVLAVSDGGERELQIATRHAPPFSILTEGKWNGVTIDLMRKFAADNGYTLNYRQMGLEEMLDATASGKIDLAAAALTVTAEREERLDFSHPFFTSGIGIAVQQQPQLTWAYALKRIVSSDFLLSAGALLALLTLVGVLVWFVERRKNTQFASEPIKGIGSGLWWSAVTMTTVGYGDKSPITLAGRMLGLIWMFASVIIISGFTAAIATSLTVGQLEQTVQGADDLYGKRVATAEGTTSAAYLDERLIRYRATPTLEEALDRLAHKEADAVVYDLPILRYLVKEHYAQEVRVLPTILVRQDYGIALPTDSPLREELNREILRIIQGDDWNKLVTGYLGSEP